MESLERKDPLYPEQAPSFDDRDALEMSLMGKKQTLKVCVSIHV